MRILILGHWTCTSLLCVALAACSESGGGSEVAVGMTLLSPASLAANVRASRISIEIDGNNLDSLQASSTTTGFQGQGVLSGDSWLVHDVPLVTGANTIELIGKGGNDREVVRELTLTYIPAQTYGMSWSASPQVATSAPVAIRFDVAFALPATPTEILLDAAGDGVFEVRQPFAPRVESTIEASGTWQPRLLLRTADNELISMDPESAPIIRIVPDPTPDPALSYTDIGAGPSDLHFEPASGRLFVLSGGDREIRVFGPDRALQTTIDLPGLSQPSGFGFDATGNIYIADSSEHVVLKLSAPTYSPDVLVGASGLFGSQGSEDGQFEAPADVAVEGSGENLKIFVADTGNSRVQQFNRAGIHEATHDGATNGGSGFVAPRSVVPVPGGGIAVLDPTELRILSKSGEIVGRFGAFQDARHLTLDSRNGGFVIADAAAGAISLRTLGGGVRRSVATSVTNLRVATVAVGAEGGVLLEAGDGSTRIKGSLLPEDPVGETPFATIDSFLSAVAAGDLDIARQSIADEQLTEFDAAIAEQATVNRVLAQAQQVINLVTVDVTATTAIVRGERDTGSSKEAVEFVLERNNAGRWRIKNF